MLAVVLALAPIFLLILLGHALKRWRFVENSFWPATEKITYYITFPALLTENLAKASLGGLPWREIVAVISGTTILTGVVVLVVDFFCRPRQDHSANAALSSAFQGAVRPNTYVGLAGAAALYGHDGITITALCIAATVPLVNILSVSVLMMLVPPSGFSGGMGHRLWAVLVGIMRNPIIIACAVGIILNLTGLGLPPIVGPLFEILAKASLPMGLLAVGAGLALGKAKGASENNVYNSGSTLFALSALAKLALLPALTAASLAALAGGGITLSHATIGTMILWGGLPCSASSYVLARQMGGDAPMMAAIITWQTVFAMASLPALIALLPYMRLP